MLVLNRITSNHQAKNKKNKKCTDTLPSSSVPLVPVVAKKSDKTGQLNRFFRSQEVLEHTVECAHKMLL